MAEQRLFDNLTLPASFDAHVHLRQSHLMRAVTPTITSGGVDTVYVMPNLMPPIDTVEAALNYKAQLQAICPDVTFLMTLYLCDKITPEVVRDAKARGGVVGVKSYPAGVTTNSAAGVVDYAPFYPVFAEMERQGLVLNLHGEVPSDRSNDVNVLNAEEKFLPTLALLSERFPNLKIVLEHCTTRKAVEAVMEAGENVRGTITAHHLWLVVDDWAGDGLHFCKPVAKTEGDKRALVKATVEGKGNFFLGTDSAPHLLGKKKGVGLDKCSAGVFTQPYATQVVLEAWEEGVRTGLVEKEELAEEVIEGFLGKWGRDFYGIEESKKKFRLKAGQERVAESLAVEAEGDVIVPFRRGEQTYSIEWV
jgi:dihydroorotase